MWIHLKRRKRITDSESNKKENKEQNVILEENDNNKEMSEIIKEDKNNDEYTSSSQFEDYKNNNKNRNIIIKQNNNVIKRLSDDPSGNIDISIQFNDKTPKGLFNIRTTKRFPVSANKNRKIKVRN